MSRETYTGAEPASPNDLLEVHGANTFLLAEQGEFLLEREDQNKYYENFPDDAPVVHDPPCLEMTILGDEICALLPEAAHTLRVEDTFVLIYFLPHYQRLQVTDELLYFPPASAFNISSPEGSIKPAINFRIVYDPESESCGGSKSLINVKRPTTEYLNAEEVPISRDECTAILEIIDKFNRLIDNASQKS